MNVLALEPWFGGSHKRFLTELQRHSEHEVRSVELAPRFWKWRMQGGAVTLAEKAQAIVEGGFVPDVIFASDMVNLPAFLALTRDILATTPTVLFFHENQLTYPLPDGKERDMTYAYINYLSALTADRLVFNSAFHQNEFFGALPDLLRRFPDYNHVGTLPSLRDKSQVLHLGIHLAGLDAVRPDAEAQRAREPGPPVILWNHRWEYDKNPEAFFRLINRLDDAGAPFRLILAGQTFHEQPPEFESGFRRYADRVLHYGYAESFEDYARLLWRSDIVVSTSIHEFFGVSMMEAIACGCHPLLPNRLTYPELIPDALHRPLLHAPVLYNSDDELFDILKGVLTSRDQRLPASVLREVVEPLAWSHQIEGYDAMFESVARSASA